MKQISRVLVFVLALDSLLISACGTAAGPSATPGNAVASPSATTVSAAEVAYTGVIELIDGIQWTVNGQTITVVPTVVRDGPFKVGNVIKVEGVINSDASFTVTRVESATPEDISGLPQLGNDNSNDANSNDINANDDNSNNSNSNDG